MNFDWLHATQVEESDNHALFFECKRHHFSIKNTTATRPRHKHSTGSRVLPLGLAQPKEQPRLLQQLSRFYLLPFPRKKIRIPYNLNAPRISRLTERLSTYQERLCTVQRISYGHGTIGRIKIGSSILKTLKLKTTGSFNTSCVLNLLHDALLYSCVGSLNTLTVEQGRMTY